MKPIARPARQAQGKPVPRGNPLESVPLSALTATPERPTFSPPRPRSIPKNGKSDGL